MKKILTIAMLMLIAASCTFAQYRPHRSSHHRGGYGRGSDTNNEISVGVGGFTTQSLVGFVESITSAADMESEELNLNSYGPAFTAQYLYKLSERIGLGAGLVYQSGTGIGSLSTSFGTTTSTYTFSGSYITLMPTIKIYWFNKEHFGMYTKVAVGGTYRMETTNGVSDNSFMFNGQLSTICAEFGGEQFRGFLESGVGASGSIVGGLKYSF